MNTNISFGIGCFHFGVKKMPPFEFKGTDYLLELNNVLSKITSLTNLKVETDEEFKNLKLIVSEPIEEIGNDEGYFPNSLILDIEFNLFIPYRIQAEIIGPEEKYLSTFSENFSVKIIHGYFLPVAIIETISPTSENDPSDAVQIVREFIKRELSNNKSDYIRFESLGPSPFHCNFFISPKSAEDTEDYLFSSDLEFKKGYNKLTIYYNSEEINDASEALRYLYSSISDEFGYFYKCMQIRSSKITDWIDIHENLNTLMEVQNSKGVNGYIQRLLRRPKLIGELFTDIATFETKAIFQNGMQQNEYNETFSVKEEIFFKELIDKKLEEKIDYPIKQTTELIQFFESRRVKSVELITAVTAAILGGAIGALLTIFLQGNQINNSIPIEKKDTETNLNIISPTNEGTVK